MPSVRPGHQEIAQAIEGLGPIVHQSKSSPENPCAVKFPLLASSLRVGGIRSPIITRNTMNKANSRILRHYHACEQTADLSKGGTITNESEAVWTYKPASSFVHTPFVGSIVTLLIVSRYSVRVILHLMCPPLCVQRERRL